jgi:hypothetical protein
MPALSAMRPPLSREDLAQYHVDGFLILRSVFTPAEIAVLDEESRGLLDRMDLIDQGNIRCRWQDHAQTRECRFDCFDPVIDLSEAARRVATDPRLIEPLSAIYGERACLFKDKLIFKPPGAKGYAMHQDYIAWPTFPKSFVTAIVAIDPTDVASGATELFGGYHRQGCMSPIDGEYHELAESAVDLSRGVLLDLAPGDVALFSGFVPHRSEPNTSDQWRRQLYLSYNALSDGGEQREKHYAEFHTWLKSKYAQHGKTDVWFR